MAGSRRDFLSRSALGFGSVALAAMLAREGVLPRASASAEIAPSADPLAARPPHFEAKATSVIFLFLTGGPSQMETFDPKPLLNRFHGQSLPESFGSLLFQQTNEKSLLLGSKRSFRPHGESGLVMSDLFPHLASCADDISVIRSCHADSITHAPAMYQMNTGRVMMGHPSLGSWAVYGLGNGTDNLPAFVVMLDPEGPLTGGPPCWGSGYLPPVYQGMPFRSGDTPLLHLRPAGDRSPARQRAALDLLRDLNHAGNRLEDDPIMGARLSSYELAFNMQSHAVEAVDVASEPEETRNLYGLDRPETEEFGRRCLLARRLVERGVRFVQLYHGGGPGNMTWDAHGDIEENHLRMAGEADRPIAGLLTDLKRRGLLDNTLVVCGGEFGRTPMSQGSTGRDHNPYGFSMWLAGGGVQGGRTVGSTDDFGLRAAENPRHVRDLHATILHLLGLDQYDLTVMHDGREEKLTDTGGEVITEIL
jgi:hypothetical protein